MMMMIQVKNGKINTEMLIEKELNELLLSREDAKINKDWKKCDEIRDLLMTQYELYCEDNVDENGKPIATYENIQIRNSRIEEQKKEKTKLLQKHQRENQLNGKGDIDQIPTKRHVRNFKKSKHNKTQKQRFQAFASWLLENFQFVNVLDVAGGQGSLCWELVMNRQIACTVVDPKAVKFSITKSETLISLSKNHETIKSSQSEATPYLHPKVIPAHDVKVVQQAVAYFQKRGGNQVCSLFDDAFLSKHVNLLQDIDLVVGLHPDQATDLIVDYALQAKKPFACVPCCVFPNLFNFRKLRDGTPVRTLDQLCQYLSEKAPDGVIQKTVVDTIPGPCNTVLWYRP